jgi:hypothetical protein
MMMDRELAIFKMKDYDQRVHTEDVTEVIQFSSLKGGFMGCLLVSTISIIPLARSGQESGGNLY